MEVRQGWQWTAWLILGCIVGGSFMADARAPQVAGQFYPADTKQLQQTVDRFLQSVSASVIEGELIALLSPHAGYVFSGLVQAYSYRLLQGTDFSTVLVIGTAHYSPTEKGALFDGEEYQTPLGAVRTDKEFLKALLAESPLLEANSKAHEYEHSVETQIPFLQRTLPSSGVVAMVIGTPDFATLQQIGQAIARVIQKQSAQGKKILLIASSDLSHYPTDEDARAVDSSTLAALTTMNPRYFSKVNAEWMQRGVGQLACTYCGEGALTIVLVTAKELGANQAQILRYATSADVPSGEKERVVGYASVAFLRSNKEESTPFSVSNQTQKKLLKMARSAIEMNIETKRIDNLSFDYPKEDPLLNQAAAVFVTLKKEGQLRGCIGGTEARMPLGQGVQYFACAAAFDDPRFPPLTKEELSKVHLEVSILSPMQRVASAEEIIPGVHGVVVKWGMRSGLFLPQVWSETGWTKEVFLDQLCSQKAGLAPRAWQDPQTELYTFTVFSFEEAQEVR